MSTAPPEPPPFQTRNILGVEISVARQRDAIDFLLRRLEARLPMRVAFANANLLTEVSAQPGGARLLVDFLVLNDGIAVDLASLALYRHWFPDNLNGTDLVPALLAALPRGGRVFLYGAKPDVVAKAAAHLAEQYGCVVCGAVDGFTTLPAESIAAQAADARPDILLVALGNPLQEEWIAAHAAATGAPLAIGVGALFDFMAGAVPRAPAPMRRLRLEWLYRWAHEPGRLRRRYSIGMTRFSARVLRQGWHRET
ncbi:MAG: WecB/TagA/CpsF family glycosyltransferase [Methylobacteriaceae bacterium]|nr:WecB/TagA/CpsF family glycosyltransferase [Methylobacteriaceae bacterium]